MDASINKNKTYEDLKLENSKLAQEIEKLRNERVEVDELRQQVISKDSEISVLHEKVHLLETQKGKIPEEAGKSVENNIVSELEVAVRERDGKISALEAELKKSRKEVQSLQEELVKTDSTLAQLLDKNDKLEHEAMIYRELAEEKEEELTSEMNKLREEKDKHIRVLERELFDIDIKLGKLQQSSEESMKELREANKNKMEKLSGEYDDIVHGLVKSLSEKDVEYLKLKLMAKKDIEEVEKELFDSKIKIEQLEKRKAEREEQEIAIDMGLKELKKRLLKKKRNIFNLGCLKKGKKGGSKLDIVQDIVNNRCYQSYSC